MNDIVKYVMHDTTGSSFTFSDDWEYDNIFKNTHPNLLKRIKYGIYKRFLRGLGILKQFDSRYLVSLPIEYVSK